VKIEAYHSDNGVFTAHEFSKVLKENELVDNHDNVCFAICPSVGIIS